MYQIIQTLVELDLCNNLIGAQGVQYLAEALQKNDVKSCFFLFCSSYRISY